MPKSLLDRLSAEDFALIKDSVYFDPTSPSGLRWSHENRHGYKRGHGAGDPVGKTFFIGDKSYSASNIVLILHDIWPGDHQNVVTRKDPNGPWSDVGNLQWADRGESNKRATESRRIAHVRAVLGHDEPDLGDCKRLNVLCNKSHQWNGIDLSLQKKCGKSWKCLECEKERDAKRRQTQKHKDQQRQRYLANQEQYQAAARARMRARRESMIPEQLAQLSEKTKQHHKTFGRNSRAKGMEDFVIPPHLVGTGIAAVDLLPFKEAQWNLSELKAETVLSIRDTWRAIKNIQPSPTVLELVTAELKNAWSVEKIEFIEQGGSEEEWIKESNRRRHRNKMKTDPDYVLYYRQKSKRRKAMMRDSVAIQITGKQIRARFAQFDHCCAYCGADGDLHIEHVVPISKGGGHAIGNIVPACKDCNYSKRDRDAEQWYRQQPFYSDLRWRKICRVLGWSRSSVGQMALL